MHKIFSDKFPFRRSVVGSDSQPQLTEEQRRDRHRSIQLHMQLLQHASGCRNQQCPSANCNKIEVTLTYLILFTPFTPMTRRIFWNMVQLVWHEYKVAARFAVVFGRCCRFMHANVVVMHVWCPNADSWRSSCGHLPNSKPKWMSVVELLWMPLIAGQYK